MISLVTQRLVLRPWVPEDEAVYIELATDPEVMKYIGAGQPLDRTTAAERFGALDQSWDLHGFGLLAVERIDTTTPVTIGFAGLGIPSFLPQILPSVEIGWRLSPAHWGMGFATEASASVVEWAFKTLELDRLVSVINQTNDRSRRVATKLGMSVERRTVIADARVWVEVYELMNSALSESSPAGSPGSTQAGDK